MMNNIPKDMFDALRQIEQTNIFKHQFDQNVWTKNIHQYDEQFISKQDKNKVRHIQNGPEMQTCALD